MSEIIKKDISTKDSNSAYTNRLSMLREREHLTQEEFAEKINVSVPLVTSMERQNKKLTLRNAMVIAKEFNVSLDWLYGLSDDTNDSASNILLALKDIFNIDLEEKCIEIDENLAKFIENLSIVYKAKKEYNLPEKAFEYWIDGIKKEYNEAPKSDKIKKYYLEDIRQHFKDPPDRFSSKSN